MTHSSDEYVSLSWFNLTHKEILTLGNLSRKVTPDILEGIFGIEVDKIQDIYAQAGIRRPYIESLSMEALYYAMAWLYLTGRTSFGLNAYGKIEWLVSEAEDRISIPYSKATLQAVTTRLRSIANVPKNDSWMLKYMAKTLMEGMPNDRRGVLSDLFLSNRRTFYRPEYKNVDKYFDIEKLTYQRRKLFFTKLQFHCLMDTIRLESCHVYKGNREDVAFVIRGSQTRAQSVLPKMNIPLPVVGVDGDLANAFVRALKLKKKDPPKGDKTEEVESSDE